MTKLMLVSRSDTTAIYRVEDGAGQWCRVSMFLNDNPKRLLSTFGGSSWPDHWPDVFKFYGSDPSALTAHSSYCFLEEVTLPTMVEPDVAKD